MSKFNKIFKEEISNLEENSRKKVIEYKDEIEDRVLDFIEVISNEIDMRNRVSKLISEYLEWEKMRKEMSLNEINNSLEDSNLSIYFKVYNNRVVIMGDGVYNS